jgi:hypothetical protein
LLIGPPHYAVYPVHVRTAEVPDAIDSVVTIELSSDTECLAAQRVPLPYDPGSPKELGEIGGSDQDALEGNEDVPRPRSEAMPVCLAKGQAQEDRE